MIHILHPVSTQANIWRIRYLRRSTLWLTRWLRFIDRVKVVCTLHFGTEAIISHPQVKSFWLDYVSFIHGRSRKRMLLLCLFRVMIIYQSGILMHMGRLHMRCILTSLTSLPYVCTNSLKFSLLSYEERDVPYLHRWVISYAIDYRFIIHTLYYFVELVIVFLWKCICSVINCLINPASVCEKQLYRLAPRELGSIHHLDCLANARLLLEHE